MLANLTLDLFSGLLFFLFYAPTLDLEAVGCTIFDYYYYIIGTKELFFPEEIESKTVYYGVDSRSKSRFYTVEN